MSTTHTTQYQASIVEFESEDCLGIAQPVSDLALATRICADLGLELVEDIDGDEGVWLVAGLTKTSQRTLNTNGVWTQWSFIDQLSVYQLEIELDA